MTAKELKKVYSSEEFSQKFYYGGQLGAIYGETETIFRIWSPLASSVTLMLYEDGGAGDSIESLSMVQEGKGVFECKVRRDLHGIYYDFLVNLNGSENRTADPYARACGVNGKRSMVIDLKRTNPEGWEEDRAPQYEQEQIVYEIHVKEFSWDKAGGFPTKVRGKYKAFQYGDTTLNQDGIHPTGMGYMKNLGVTHVQLMPVYDYGSVDEMGDNLQFNWGYDPVNYNVPEGSYSMDPFHGEVRVRELKELVQALHSNGFRVIMDVVYNHTFSLDSWFERTVPGYYYRQNTDGTYSNGSACGNDVASERPMCSKYILDSVLYWASEYHIDGFRFDLMGLLNVELMNEIQHSLDEKFGRGEKLMFGEPWAAGDSPMESGCVPALKENVGLLDENIGIFCDATRDAVKGHVFAAEVPGFVNGQKGLEEEIFHSVSAWCEEGQKIQAKAPSQIVTYISAHDNLTLWDKLILSMRTERDFHCLDPKVLRAYKLAAVICATCQGRLFLLSGEEFARTKEGIEDSYCSSIEINRLDWEAAYKNQKLVEYYQGLFALRKQLFGLCDKSKEAPGRIFHRKIEAHGCVSFSVNNRKPDGSGMWSELFVIYNSREETQRIELPEGNWEILVDGTDSFLWKSPEICQKRIEADPVSAMVLGKRG